MLNDLTECGPSGFTAPAVAIDHLPPTSAQVVDQIRQLEAFTSTAPQLDLVTQHVLHAGMYARTIRIPKGAVITTALIKIATVLIVNGHCSVLVGDGQEVRVDGYRVFAASAGRMQVYLAHDDTTVTMLFPTSARSIEAAEAAFTDEAERLLSRRGVNEITITGG